MNKNHQHENAHIAAMRSPTMAKLASRNWHGRLVLCRFGYAFVLLLVDRVIACGTCLLCYVIIACGMLYCLWNGSIACGSCHDCGPCLLCYVIIASGMFHWLWNVSIACGSCHCLWNVFVSEGRTCVSEGRTRTSLSISCIARVSMQNSSLC